MLPTEQTNIKIPETKKQDKIVKVIKEITTENIEEPVDNNTKKNSASNTKINKRVYELG